MTLLKLDILSVRNIHRATLLPSPSVNFIIGPNASGKSSLLEAIFILGRARSFRAAQIRQAIEFDQTDLIVSAQVRQQNEQLSQLGIQINQQKYDIHINRETKSKSDLAYFLPLQLIHPKSYRLLDAGPQVRREFIDWGSFNDQPNFLPAWRNFKKVLQQRNSLLKRGLAKEVHVWNLELVKYGVLVNEYRENYIRRLQPVFLDVCRYFLADVDLELNYFCGWDREQDLLQVLDRDHDKDMRYGYTHSGPHRADFKLLFHGRNARDYVSRGQLKLLVLGLKLAQVELLHLHSGRPVYILIDDLSAELDTVNRTKLVKYLADLNCQVFMSSTELADFGEINDIENYKVFHVEHGAIASP
ncbi:DNA replication/repair protein RecF [Methylomarinum sp. Ch1-1]|uniref:DNA replication and repair protein RecF n=1 Tax=Methylomarinum roseum TaxID=3067653 RepID=A0AAU7NW40_9GAMM|nr:DNA replication/repair protein RecF [Methylomarinum sp. Ch1-1]MDP4522731.1 DNA replication/repair protein RecF [Methylomarinum sp. Ch1-1]